MPKREESPVYYTNREIRQRFKWSSREMVSAVAQRQGWRYLNTWPRQYLAKDVEAYARSRLRVNLQREMGIPTRGLFKSAAYDRTCPKCGGFACYRKPKDRREQTIWKKKAKRGRWPWHCEQGHHGGEK